jgi:serine protease Do
VAVRAGASGIGFAIPVDKAIAVAGDLLASVGIKKSWHGVVLAQAGAGSNAPVTIASVEAKSPAEAAGLKTGDVLTEVSNIKIDRPLDFQRAMLELSSGQAVPVTVERGDSKVAVTLTLTDAPTVMKPFTSPTWELLGLELKPIPQQEFRKQFQTRYRGGLSVTAVRPASPAADQGIRRGDVLVGMHSWETLSLENVNWIVNQPDFAAINPVKFFILRGSETLYGFMAVSATKGTRE